VPIIKTAQKHNYNIKQDIHTKKDTKQTKKTI